MVVTVKMNMLVYIATCSRVLSDNLCSNAATAVYLFSLCFDFQGFGKVELPFKEFQDLINETVRNISIR